LLAKPHAQASAGLLQECRAFFTVDSAPYCLPPLTTRTSLAWDGELGPSPLDSAPAVGERSSLASRPRRAERDGQKHLLV
jgi:hypothetical protein